MKTNQYRNNSIAAAVAATLVTTVLVASLVESFEPAQLFRLNDEASSEIVAEARRAETAAAEWT
jgi:hypothetical protein